MSNSITQFGVHIESVKDAKDDEHSPPVSPRLGKKQDPNTIFSLPFAQKLLAELVGTFYLVFAGCAAMAVENTHNGVVTLVGIALVWGAVVMVLVYSLIHVSAHFNPAVTLAFASTGEFPLKHAPIYIILQVLGSTLASATLRLMFDLDTDMCNRKHFLGNMPSGANLQAFVMEFVITGFLMFVVCATATDNRAFNQLSGLAIGGAVLLNVLFSAEVSGASMNPARSLGPAIVWSCYGTIWIYLVAPTCGAITGAWIYNLLRHTDKNFGDVVKCRKFLDKIHHVSP